MRSTTGTSPTVLWNPKHSKLTRIFQFGQAGVAYIPFNPSTKGKLEPRGIPVTYCYVIAVIDPIDHKQVCVINRHTNRTYRIRPVDFHEYNPETDPCAMARNALTTTVRAAIAHPLHSYRINYTLGNSRRTICITNHIPISLKHDAISNTMRFTKQWEISHNKELDKLDSMGAIKWGPLPEKLSKLIPLIMTYRYKRDKNGNIVERKARCSIRGDLMRPNIHFDPAATTAHLTDKQTIRTVFAIIAQIGLQAEHFDITSAFKHEKYAHEQPIFVKKLARFDGTMKHNHATGQLIFNVYGTPPAGHLYLKGCIKFLKRIGFKQSPDDPCLFILIMKNDFSIICLNIDDFLVAAKTKSLIDSTFGKLQSKYTIKRLGFPLIT